MSRKQLLILLPVLSMLALAAASQFLLPADSPFVIGRTGPESTAQMPFSAPELTDELESETKSPAPAARDADRERDFAGELRRQAALIEAERRAGASESSAPEAQREPQPIQSSSEDTAAAEEGKPVNVFRDTPRPPGQTLGNLRPRPRRLGGAKGVKPLSEVSERLRQDRGGLYARYYDFQGNPVNELQNAALESRTPSLTRIDRQIHFPSKEAWSDLPFDLTNFMAVWEGFLVIDEPGDYWLFIGADYMAHVELSGEAVLLNNIRDYTEVSAVLTLEAGLHPLRITYAEGKNGSPVDPLGSCKFMYVPKGEGQPKPIPPEMLMVPEWMWSDSAPIITRLSRNSGAIGDVITIFGQGLDPEGPGLLNVYFTGQRAEILQGSDSSLRVRVPIGSVSGDVVVQKQLRGTGGARAEGWAAVPSNSLRFNVTNQFGLVAQWHNLEGWANYDFVDPNLREPDLVRLERDFMFNSRDELDLPFRNNPLACRWEGKLGYPEEMRGRDGSPASILFMGHSPFRVSLGDKTIVAHWDGAGHRVQYDAQFSFIDWPKPFLGEFLPLTIDFIAPTADASILVAFELNGLPGGVRKIGPQFFFPPVTPPQPPVISHVRPLLAEGELPRELPYDVLTDKPSIREGQTFEFRLTVFGGDDVKAEPVRVSVDSETVSFEVVSKRSGRNGEEIRTCRGVLPSGIGEGEMRARLGLSSSETVWIDVQNKGLVAYLYDLPNPGGYTHMPDLGPLTCFQVRKDAWINFENGNDFGLPFPAETFAIEWYGALIVEHEGDYVFTCRSDDGVLIWLNGQLIVDDNNLHYQREKSSAAIRLTPGVYQFKAEFFENNVHEVCVLDWQAKLNDEIVVPRQIIPKRNWTWDEHPPLPAKTSTGKRTDGSDP